MKMIKLTNFRSDTFTLNALYIERVQSFPDTTITLTNGKKLVVKESEADVVELINQYYQMIGLSGSLKEVGEENE